MSDEFQESLSADGRRRREEILRMAQRQARRVRRVRLIARTAAACLVLAVFGGAWMWTQRRIPAPPQIALPGKTPATTPAPAPSPKAVPTRSAPQIVVTRIETDSTLLSKWAIPAQKPTWQKLDDNALFDQLAAAGRPGGLVTIGGRTKLMYRESR
jgi:hypothetical protein